VKTAQTLVQNDIDLNKKGLIAGIDLLRARVEFQTQQRRLIAAENQVQIDKLTLERVIGFPSGQEFRLTNTVPFAALKGITQEQALQQAHSIRPDFLSAKAQVRAAELARQAASAENYPTFSTATNYGDIGSPNFGSSHGTRGFALTLNIPIYQGSRVRADKLKAGSALQQRWPELADLEDQIDDQVRTAFFNLQSSSKLVSVAKSNIDLANQTLGQAQNRFRAGVADNLELVQARESVASANPSYLSSLFAYNFAKISLARAIGVADQSALHYLGAK
jgi:outer membrane protein TolC